MYNLNNKDSRNELAQQIRRDIDEYCKELYPNDHRNHLGASEMGEECHRKLYSKFRWFKKPDFDGRMLRLFNVGHTAEPRFITYLKGIGFEVKEFDEDGKQFRISGAKGHYGGSLDGMCKAPARYNLDSELVFLNEYKTNKASSELTKLEYEELRKIKPKHFAQMCQYGAKYKLKYGIYLIENKDNSDITIKIVELDWKYGEELEKKAEEIIFAKEPPAKIAENESFFNCKWCNEFRDICHKGAKPDKNCRSCRHSMPVENGEWFCSKFNGNIPAEFIPSGCPDWLAI